MTTKAQKAAAEAKAAETEKTEELASVSAMKALAILAPFADSIDAYEDGGSLDDLRAAVAEPAEVEATDVVAAMTLELRDGQKLHVRRKQVLGEFVVAEARLSPG